MQLIFEAPLNSLSFGNVSYNILRELYKRGVSVALFIIGEKGDLSAFDPAPDFVAWIKDASTNRYKKLKRIVPSLKLWHLTGSDLMRGPHQRLFTFHETNKATDIECSIARMQERCFFSSKFSHDVFQQAGLLNVDYANIGFDEDIKPIDVPKPEGIHFTLMGKFEKRKQTEKIIRLWLQKYGNVSGFSLNLCVNNPFFKQEDMQAILGNVFENKRYKNVNLLPFLPTNKDVNQLYCLTDIDLTGLSGGEGWNLPAFNMTCLGKWSIINFNTAHMDWANENNSIIVYPDHEFEAHDGVFFKRGGDFNQGCFFGFNDEHVIRAMEMAVDRVKSGQINTEGTKLPDKFNYKNTVDKLLSSWL